MYLCWDGSAVIRAHVGFVMSWALKDNRHEMISLNGFQFVTKLFVGLRDSKVVAVTCRTRQSATTSDARDIKG